MKETLNDDLERSAVKFASIYIHYPFCLRKCNYCDFASVPCHEHGELAARYPALLKAELELWREAADFSALRTVYFGGGTPSLLPAEEIAALLALLPPATEITLEANPETLDGDKLAALREAGIDRLSIGAQSFDEKQLLAMGRGHSPGQTRQAMELARLAGFDNIGLDLIYGLPGQTLADWQEDIRQAVALEPQHISLYALTLSPQTPWGRLAAEGRLIPADDDAAAEMEEAALEMLRAAGYGHYEIANFARSGFESRHNSAYWRRENYLGLGAAAASCAAEHRWANERDINAYAAAIDAGRLPKIEEEWLSIDQVMGEAIFLGLRLLEGVDTAAFAAQYGADPLKRFRKSIDRMIRAGLMEVDGPMMRLTEKGVLLGNQVFAEFV